MRLPSFSILMTLTWTSWPIWTSSFGSVTRRRLISETCSRPSMPPRSTKAPNGVSVLMRPVSSAPGTMRAARFGGALGGCFLQQRGARDDDAAAVIGELGDAELDTSG